MKIDLTDYFNCDLKTYEKLLYDDELLKRIQNLPNLAERKVLEKKEDERYVHNKIYIVARGPIPKAVTSVLKPKMLCWVEESVHDKQKHVVEWKIIPEFFKDIIKCSGTYNLYPEGKNRTRREIKGELKARLLLTGRIIERTIYGYLKENLAAEVEIVNKLIEERKKKKA